MSSVERESMEVDVLYIGAGPASLASALHLMNQVKAFNRRAESEGKAPIEPPSVLVLEKGAAVGDHMLSGAVMNPRGIRELVPDFVEKGFPTEYICDYAGFWIFHPMGKVSVPGPFTVTEPVPLRSSVKPPLGNVRSLAKFSVPLVMASVPVPRS